MEMPSAVLDRLTRIQPELSPQVRKAAAHVLENPGQVATLSMRKLAAAAEVPPPTMARLAKAAGFETYEAFRDVYRRSVQDGGSAYSERAGQLLGRRGQDELVGLWADFRQASLDGIERLFATIDPGLVTTAADVLLAARRVFVAGMQSSFSFANYVHYVGYMTHPNWVLLRSSHGVLADHVVDLDAEDVLLAIALKPCARDTVRLAQLARERNAPVIAVTDSRTSPLAVFASHLFVVPTRSPQYFDSYVPTTALLEALLGVVTAKSGPDVIDNIERLEDCRRALGEYWEDEPGSRRS